MQAVALVIRGQCFEHSYALALSLTSIKRHNFTDIVSMAGDGGRWPSRPAAKHICTRTCVGAFNRRSYHTRMRTPIILVFRMGGVKRALSTLGITSDLRVADTFLTWWAPPNAAAGGRPGRRRNPLYVP